MSDRRPDRFPWGAVLEVLEVRRNARIGFAVGVVVAVLAYLVRVLELWGPVAGTREYPIVGPEAWFILLAFVLATTLGGLVTVALTVRVAVKESRRSVRE